MNMIMIMNMIMNMSMIMNMTEQVISLLLGSVAQAIIFYLSSDVLD